MSGLPRTGARCARRARQGRSSPALDTPAGEEPQSCIAARKAASWCVLSRPALPRGGGGVSLGIAVDGRGSVRSRIEAVEERLARLPPCLPGSRDTRAVAKLLTTRCCQNLPRHAASTLLRMPRVETIYNDFPYYSSSNNLINVPNMVLLVCL